MLKNKIYICTYKLVMKQKLFIPVSHLMKEWRKQALLLLYQTSRYSTYKPSYSANVKPDKVPVQQFIGDRTSRQNRVHVCGLSVTGALGCIELPEPKGKRIPRIAQISPYLLRLPNISHVACGYGFTILASKRKDAIKVWGCGVNTDSQVGFQKNRIFKPKKGEISNPSFAYVHTPAPIPLPLKTPQTIKVEGVACGRAHTLILTNNAGIFTIGNNAFGQCGRTIIEGEIYNSNKRIHQIPHNYFPSKVTSITCGMDHSLFLTKAGEVFACGWGADGQTGLGSLNKTSEPTQVKGDIVGVNIKKLSTFADTTLALSEEGQVYGWGSSEYQQLTCVSEDIQVTQPKLLPFSEYGKIVDIAAGGTGCLILNDAGEVFVWGYGILGKGPELEHTSKPSMIPMTLFGKTPLESDVKVKRIKSGLSSYAAINSKGELFTWGKNKGGCLGLGHNSDQYFPWRVVLGTEVRDVFCGVDHTVMLSKTLL